MATIIGFGGALVRVDDPEALYGWYEANLGLTRTNGAFEFPPERQAAQTVLAFFTRDDTCFPATQPVMLNLQVEDVAAVLDRVAAAGATVDPERPSYDFGTFGWFADPQGNRVELWQPAPEG